MAQQFALNQQSLDYITQATWSEATAAKAVSGGVVFNRWRLHQWQTNVMPAVEFDALRGRLGERVNLTTTDYDDPNGDYVTYYGATVDSVRGNQDGPVFTGVTAEFRVKV